MKSSFYLKYALKQGAVAFALVAVIILIFGPISVLFLKEYTAVCLVIVGALLLLMLVPMFAAASLERRHGLLHPQPVDDAWRKRLFDNASAIGTGVLLFALNLCSATLAPSSASASMRSRDKTESLSYAARQRDSSPQ